MFAQSTDYFYGSGSVQPVYQSTASNISHVGAIDPSMLPLAGCVPCAPYPLSSVQYPTTPTHYHQQLAQQFGLHSSYRMANDYVRAFQPEAQLIDHSSQHYTYQYLPTAPANAVAVYDRPINSHQFPACDIQPEPVEADTIAKVPCQVEIQHVAPPAERNLIRLGERKHVVNWQVRVVKQRVNSSTAASPPCVVAVDIAPLVGIHCSMMTKYLREYDDTLQRMMIVDLHEPFNGLVSAPHIVLSMDGVAKLARSCKPNYANAFSDFWQLNRPDLMH